MGVHSTSASSCDIVALNPQTGATKTLVANAFKDFWGGSFISDREAGTGYVITESRQLLQYDLSTGHMIAKVPLHYGGPLERFKKFRGRPRKVAAVVRRWLGEATL